MPSIQTRPALTLRECPRAHFDDVCSYDVLLRGQVVSRLNYRTHGYVGALPMPSGGECLLPESPLSRFRQEVCELNAWYAEQEGPPKPGTGAAFGIFSAQVA